MSGSSVFTPWQCRHARQLLGLSVGKLAAKAGVEIGYLGLYEAGLRPIASRSELDGLLAVRTAFREAGIITDPAALAQGGWW